MNQKKTTFKKIFIFYFILTSIIPTGLVGCITFLLSANQLIEQQIQSLSYRLSEATTEINNKISDKESLGIKYSLDPSVKKVLHSNTNNVETLFSVQRDLYSNEYVDVNDIVLIAQNTTSTITNGMLTDSESYLLARNAENLFQNNNQESIWGTCINISGENFIPFYRKIPNGNTYGYFISGIQENLIQEIFDNYMETNTGNCYLIDTTQNILSSNKKSSSASGKFLNKMLHSSKKYHKFLWEGKPYYGIIQNTENQQWKNIYIISQKQLLSDAEKTFLVPILGVIFSGLFSMLAAITLSSFIMTPIHELTDTIRTVEQGDLNVRFTLPNILELSMLGNFFNEMLDRLQQNIEEIYQQQKLKRTAEIKALTLQINPHFLYNTLSSIIWLCMEDKKDEVVEMTNSLSQLLRISVSRGNEIITLREEFEHVKHYIQIQSIRFQDQFECFYELDEDIADCLVIKIILQPLVENIINHAIPNISYKGVIVIAAEKSDNNNIRIVVADNANGMTDSQIESLNNHLSNIQNSNKQYGIGTQNVNNRIKIAYGESYGLTFKKESTHIIAEILIPAIYKKGE